MEILSLTLVDTACKQFEPMKFEQFELSCD